MRTLTEIARLLASLDDVPADGIATYEKALRNLVQRHYLPPSEQQGRVFLYDDAAIVAIRLASFASHFGLSRASIEMLTRWLLSSGERRRRVDGGWIGISHAEEAIERARQGEKFAFHAVMGRNWRIRMTADWSVDQARSPRAERAVEFAGLDVLESTRFTLPASGLILELLFVLSAAN